MGIDVKRNAPVTGPSKQDFCTVLGNPVIFQVSFHLLQQLINSCSDSDSLAEIFLICPCRILSCKR
jgi:hypothetical protein